MSNSVVGLGVRLRVVVVVVVWQKGKAV